MQEITFQMTTTKVKMDNQKDVLIACSDQIPQDVFENVAKDVATMSVQDNLKDVVANV